MVTKDNVIAYLKSILLIYPEFNKAANNYKDAAKKYQNDLMAKINENNILQGKLGKVDFYAINTLQKENNNLKVKLAKAKLSNQELQRKYDKLCSALQKLITNLIK